MASRHFAVQENTFFEYRIKLLASLALADLEVYVSEPLPLVAWLAQFPAH